MIERFTRFKHQIAQRVMDAEAALGQAEQEVRQASVETQRELRLALSSLSTRLYELRGMASRLREGEARTLLLRLREFFKEVARVRRIARLHS